MRKPVPRMIVVAVMAAALLGIAGLLSACGQKGPLYLPQDQAAPADQAKDKQQQDSGKP